jgi:cysteine desulfurase
MPNKSDTVCISSCRQGKDLLVPEYLDMAATTPVSKRVADVVVHYMCVEFGNAGSRTHVWGNNAKKAVGRAREEIAAVLGARADELVFTSGATESDNLAILGLADHGRESGRMHILSSATEHKAVLEPLKRLESQGFEVELLRPDRTGRFEAEEVLEHVRADTLLVSLMHVNNETGVIQPVAELAEALRQTDTYLHVDAAQSYAKVEPEALRHPVDLISISGHKIGAPKGIGGLLVRRRRWDRVPLTPLVVGGGQERGLRAGTLPVPLIMGLLEASRERLEHLEHATAKVQKRRGEMLAWAAEAGGIVNGHPIHSAPGILSVTFPGRDAEALILELQEDMAVATGSACTSSQYTASHVLSAMGLSEQDSQASLRFSF